MNLSITKSGDTEYIFSESDGGNGCATLGFSDKSNWGITALISLSVGDHVIENIAQGALPAGAGKQRICMNCYLVTKIVKVRADCTSLSFCSHECMKKCASLLDDCGVLITTIRDWSANGQSFEINQYSDLAILAVVLLHKCKRRSDSRGLHNVKSIQRLEKNLRQDMPELSQLSAILFAQLQQHAPTLLSECMNTAANVEELLRALQFNAQPLQIPGLASGTSILTVLPQTLARVNHSCLPNAAFTYAVRNEDSFVGEKEIVVWLTCIRPIAPGEEICVSYLNQLCVPKSARGEMLYGAFGFKCQCERCEVGDIDEGRQIQDLGSDGENLSRLPSSFSQSSSIVTSRPSSSTTSTSNASVEELSKYMREIVGRLTSKAAGVGSVVNSNSSADDDILVDDEVYGLLHQSEMALSRGNCAVDAIYVIHDSGMLVLKSALGRRRGSLLQAKVEVGAKLDLNLNFKAKKKIVVEKMSIADVDATVVRAVAVISQCWTLIGCQNHLAHLDTLLSGISSGLRIGQMDQDPLPILPMKEMAIIAKTLLQLHYHAHDSNTRTQTQTDIMNNVCHMNRLALTCCNAPFISNALDLCEAGMKST